MTYSARHSTAGPVDRVLTGLKLAAAILATAVVLAAYVVLSAVAGRASSTAGDPRCALTTLTAQQCAMGFADNGLNGDN